MLFIINLTLNNRNIANQSVFLFVFWHFLSGEVSNVRARKVCLKTHFSRRSIVTALARPVIWGLVLCILWFFVLVNDNPDGLQRVHITWVCLPVVLCYKVSKSFWHHICMCAAFFSSRLSILCWSHIFIPLCSKLWYCEVEVFFYHSVF